MNATIGRHVLAGVDGSPDSAAATGWAAAEATRRHADLLLLTAYTMPSPMTPGAVYPVDYGNRLREHADRVVTTARARVERQFPALRVHTRLILADPRAALVDASADALLTVVGNRGASRLTEVLLGSVTLFVAGHARSPVAVTPYDRGVTDPAGAVLVGLDGSEVSQQAAAFAFDAASARGVELHAVFASHFDTILEPVSDDPGSPRRPDEDELAIIGSQIAGFREKYPDVEVKRHVLYGRPATALLNLAATIRPQLIVAGTRGRSGLTGLMLGSTSHGLITRAQCPVVVVPPESARDGR